jgi:hypothetical protein
VMCMHWSSRLEALHQLPLYHFESLTFSFTIIVER